MFPIYVNNFQLKTNNWRNHAEEKRMHRLHLCWECIGFMHTLIPNLYVVICLRVFSQIEILAHVLLAPWNSYSACLVRFSIALSVQLWWFPAENLHGVVCWPWLYYLFFLFCSYVYSSLLTVGTSVRGYIHS